MIAMNWKLRLLPTHFPLMSLNQQANKGLTVLVVVISLTNEGTLGYYFTVRYGRVC
jgi:hypothetical protein